ncbi:MAG TPA: hypothetical protein VGI17_12505 [Solirubrobacterales bacterium]|jgi:hypothetical protein
MAPNRITRSGATLAAFLMVAILAGCGGGSSSTTTATEAASTERSADGAILDTVLSRQEAAVEAFAEVGPSLPPRLANMAAYFRAQEQEHVDAVLKALRGLKSPAEPSPEPLDTSGLKDTRERLVFLYEVESATIDEELSAISRLEASWPRSLLASTVANQAQHLVLLRSALGAGQLDSIPVPFENGTAPPPEGTKPAE